MPIKKVNLPGGHVGYKWGDHGHIYTGKNAKEKAANQAQAAYAAGYKKPKGKK